MRRSRVSIIVLMLTVLTAMTPHLGQGEATTASSNQPTAGGRAIQNKFVGRWVSQVTRSSGEKVDDGVLDIADASPPSADRVSIVHSHRGGPVTGYTMDYPDRIELQIPLRDGRVAHYNGVLVSRGRIEGRYFVTENQQQSHHGRKRSLGEDGNWTAQAGSG
ncbi:MAG TPA: hypothetical protein VFH31_08715 [Pyrinomonadaceae bacterium]|nr:hypothetical protein [Pyrinomonadaceae bacterium]